ncbi:hypothetical protein QR680_010095 [Steinernema hermaphroditum]|uniref:Uncharacterized protein n=1 Tax=Steinernema hermaphroditum TaxID=289476 RepID=A0AA39IMP7_9BILA|nr:hypothetical protein QR680_010095 [Steinernema hermaphroditum]
MQNEKKADMARHVKSVEKGYKVAPEETGNSLRLSIIGEINCSHIMATRLPQFIYQRSKLRCSPETAEDEQNSGICSTPPLAAPIWTMSQS